MGKGHNEKAVQRVRKKELSMNKASTTRHDHVHARSSPRRPERPTSLTYNEEKDIVYACQVILKVSDT